LIVIDTMNFDDKLLNGPLHAQPLFPAMSSPKLTASRPEPTIVALKDVGVVAANIAVPFFVLLVVVYPVPA
jgi:hypothetical protein